MNIPFENLNKIDEIILLLKSLEQNFKGNKRWLNIKETSYYLWYSKDYIRKLKNSDFIETKHYYKKAWKLLFDKFELDNWVQTTSTKLDSKVIANNILKDLIWN